MTTTDHRAEHAAWHEAHRDQYPVCEIRQQDRWPSGSGAPAGHVVYACVTGVAWAEPMTTTQTEHECADCSDIALDEVHGVWLCSGCADEQELARLRQAPDVLAALWNIADDYEAQTITEVARRAGLLWQCPDEHCRWDNRDDAATCGACGASRNQEASQT